MIGCLSVHCRLLVSSPPFSSFLPAPPFVKVKKRLALVTYFIQIIPALTSHTHSTVSSIASSSHYNKFLTIRLNFLPFIFILALERLVHTDIKKQFRRRRAHLHLLPQFESDNFDIKFIFSIQNIGCFMDIPLYIVYTSFSHL